MKPANWIFVLLGIAGLIAVRFLESRLFYDPFLNYFHEANKQAAFPNFEVFKLVLGHLFRFSLNLFFSSMIIQNIFRDRKWTVQGMALMIIVFLLALPVYLYCIHTKFEIGYLFSFYMRRFVIQPLILLLIIPIFYYRRKISRN